MVAKRLAAPERGDVIWFNFNPTRGHEQSGRRPALVVSPRVYNAKSGLVLVCPVTSQTKEYPFEVVLQTRTISGVILADQIRSVDWKERGIEKAARVSEATLFEVQDSIQKLIKG